MTDWTKYAMLILLAIFMIILFYGIVLVTPAIEAWLAPATTTTIETIGG